MKKLQILETSLINKKTKLDERYKNHFDDVASANGQPLNDKRNGASTLKRWDRQSDTIHNLKQSIELTERAIEREKRRLKRLVEYNKSLPTPILELLETGELTQWKKYPNFFFIKGVKKGRFVLKNGELWHKYRDCISSVKELKIFSDLYRELSEKLGGKK